MSEDKVALESFVQEKKALLVEMKEVTPTFLTEKRLHLISYASED